MFSSTSPQYQKLFQACLGFNRQLSQSPGLYCRLEVKLGDNRRDQRRRKPPGKRMPIPGNHGVGFVAPGDSTGEQNGIIFSPASSSPPCSRHLFSPTNIPKLNGAGSFISEKGLDIQTSAPTVGPLVKCQCSWSTPPKP